MNTRRFNKPFLLTLITAFLFLQWSATHIHLAGEHEHDGVPHPHAVTVHQHSIGDYHADAIDVASDALSHADSNKLVELDRVCTHYHGKLSEQVALLPPATWDALLRHTTYQRVTLPAQQDTYQTYHQYTSIYLRAPPVVS